MMFKKFLSTILCLSMVASMGTNVFAANITTNGGSNDTLVTYGMSEEFRVTIPADFDIDTDTKKTEAIISASDVMIAHGSILNVYISGNDWNGNWELIDSLEANNRLKYIIGTNEGYDDIVNGSIILSVQAGEAYASSVKETMYFTIIDEITKAGTYNDTLTFVVEVDDSINTPEELQKKYEFKYYNTMVSAVNDVNNGTIGQNSNETKDGSIVGVYIDENNCPNIVLLEDNTETAKVTPYVDMIINLGGHTLSSNAAVTLDIFSGNVIIDGRIKGSAMNAYSDTASPRTIQARAGSLTITGGTYTVTTNTETIGVAVIQTAANTTISNAKLIANGHSNATRGISIQGNISAVLENCDINVYGIGGYNQGILIASKAPLATATLTECNIKSFANYNINGDKESSSVGIKNYGTITLNDCYVMGTHSGVDNSGTLYVNGGTFEGYGHGGFYFAATDTTSYVKNATIRDCDMPTGYTAVSIKNGSAFYMNPNGYNGEAGSGTQIVYMDGCTLSGKSHIIAMADSDNNKLYISNSTINQTDNSVSKIRIDSDTHKLYIGRGNNFNLNDTNLPEAVIETNETY